MGKNMRERARQAETLGVMAVANEFRKVLLASGFGVGEVGVSGPKRFVRVDHNHPITNAAKGRPITRGNVRTFLEVLAALHAGSKGVHWDARHGSEMSEFFFG